MEGADGTLYGTTSYGGATGYGTIFSFTPPAPGQSAWTETNLYDFTIYSNGLDPGAKLLLGADGALYGSTGEDGSGRGTVFKLTPPTGIQGAWTYSVLWSFDYDDGDGPSPLVMDASGALYGTCYSGGQYYDGTVFKLTPPTQGQTAWTLSRLWSFTGGQDGAGPTNELTLSKAGTLYGTTVGVEGGSNSGTIFKVFQQPGGNWKLQTLVIFKPKRYFSHLSLGAHRQ